MKNLWWLRTVSLRWNLRKDKLKNNLEEVRGYFKKSKE
jgi:hypothetical protein